MKKNMHFSLKTMSLVCVCVCVCVCVSKMYLIRKELFSQIHSTMNSALNTIKTYQLKYQLSIRRRRTDYIPSAMPLAAMQKRVAADNLYKLIIH